MSGARMTKDNDLSLTQSDFRPQGEMYLMPDPNQPPAEVISFNRTPAQSSDPNESFELRDMVSLAITYFDRGMIDDAEEMLNEALEAGYSRQDAVDLLRRVQSVRGQTTMVGAARTAHSEAEQQATDSVVHEFTMPLPGVDSQTSLVRRAIEDADRDLAAGRLESAHDATLHALAMAPSYLPIYVRLAEIRTAFGDSESAETLIGSLKAVLESIGDERDWLTQSMRVTLDPDNTDALVQLARSLVEQKGTLQLEPYVPEAIERTLADNPEVALELAREYIRLRPNMRQAQRLHLRAVVAEGDIAQVTSLLEREVTPDAPADLLFLRSCVAHSEGRETWFHWLERAVSVVLGGDYDQDDLARAVDASRNLLPNPQHALATSVVRMAGNDPHGALAVLDPWSGIPGRETSNASEMLIAACARAFSLRAISPIESIEALSNAVGQAVVLDVRPFAEACRLFARSISAEALMHELVAVVRETGQHEMAIRQLQALRDRMPEHLEIRTGLADLQVAAGRTAEGVRELRYIAERYEQAGNIDRMVDAMRHISAAVPNNVEMKAKLIEGYVQRGVPEDAMRELRLLGDLHHKRGRMAEAAAAYTRGAEIASTTGNYRRAMDLFERAIGADPENVGVRHAAVAYYIMVGSVDKATEQLREVVRIALQEQDPDEAVAALHQIIGLSPAEASAYHKLGEVLTSLGEYAQAERVYRRLAAFTPDDPVLTAKQSALAALAAGQ
ncbi:MAG TPA: tetratricopeptide repeat protein [Thermomicrobiales bacterium]|nr:tetratricopeptide repeat protein [Thermomicrobiales bacterium]